LEYKPKVLSSIRLIKDIIPVSKDEVELESGKHIQYTVFEYHDAAAVVALNSDNKVLLVKVPRYPIKRYLWELPGGKIDGIESPEACARRELEEESGYIAGQMEELIVFYPEPSFSTEKLHIFLATNLVLTGRNIPENEGYCELKPFDLDTAIAMIFNGQINSSWSIIGLLTAKMNLGRKQI
jgi:ADP-ribose pyrophosphatase